MRRSLPLLLVAVVATSTVVGDAKQTAPAPKRLKAFQSEAELQEYLKVLGEEQRKRNQSFRVGGNAQAVPAPAAAAAPDAAGAAGAAAESITNVQHAGVDEGGIVKLRGDH